MRVVITGADGQLGRELRRTLADFEPVPLDLPTFDLTDPSCGRHIVEAAPDVVIHAGAYTDVDGAEREQERAMAVNAQGTARVAQAAKRVGARLLYISTDYVFDGRKVSPYEESDVPSPLNHYGRSKLAGEEQVLLGGGNVLIVRTAWLYGGEGKHFVKTILALADERPVLRVVADQRGCPTRAQDLAGALRELLDSDTQGILNVTNEGSCSWFEFAQEIVAMSGKAATVEPITTAQAARLAPRPAYSVLSAERRRRLGIAMPHWKEALRQYVDAALPVQPGHRDGRA
ncbi:MAG TPA: dTDP-4-dehydrorhamnose reductase [Nitrospiraceae bacterium]|nr:dTDP-4-dehydrorhamnose reductase [Nitrospiraceae bacterium]